jgi:hypothetical protein
MIEYKEREGGSKGCKEDFRQSAQVPFHFAVEMAAM